VVVLSSRAVSGFSDAGLDEDVLSLSCEEEGDVSRTRVRGFPPCGPEGRERCRKVVRKGGRLTAWCSPVGSLASMSSG